MPRRRELIVVANAIAGSFSSRNNDVNGYWAMGQLYRRAIEVGSLQVSIHLMPHYDKQIDEPVASVVRSYREFLRLLLVKLHLPECWVSSAGVDVQFESATVMPEFLGKHAGCRPFHCQAVLVDDRARKYQASSTGWCWPHNPARETKSLREC